MKTREVLKVFNADRSIAKHEIKFLGSIEWDLKHEIARAIAEHVVVHEDVDSEGNTTMRASMKAFVLEECCHVCGK